MRDFYAVKNQSMLELEAADPTTRLRAWCCGAFTSRRIAGLAPRSEESR